MVYSETLFTTDILLAYGRAKTDVLVWQCWTFIVGCPDMIGS